MAAPLTNAAVAFVAGILTGRRAPFTAFVVGAVISALFGTELDLGFSGNDGAPTPVPRNWSHRMNPRSLNADQPLPTRKLFE